MSIGMILYIIFLTLHSVNTTTCQHLLIEQIFRL